MKAEKLYPVSLYPDKKKQFFFTFCDSLAIYYIFNRDLNYLVY